MYMNEELQKEVEEVIKNKESLKSLPREVLLGYTINVCAMSNLISKKLKEKGITIKFDEDNQIQIYKNGKKI